MASSNNPFPGMNPFLERSWRDIHTRLITYTADALQECLPDALLARAEERVFLETFPAGNGRTFSPDVIVVERPAWKEEESGTATATRAVAKPLRFTVRPSESTQRYLEILDATDGNRLVTMIEFLSESNKVPGKGRDLYLRKRDDCQEASVNIVEIDFQRRGQATTMGHLFLSEDNNPPPYHASVWRATDPEIVECHPMPLREILPLIAIPLRAEDDDATLDLQELIDLAYRRGNYQAVAYRHRPDPPFGKEDEAWMDSVLAGRT
jgi:hypothetical protein